MNSLSLCTEAESVELLLSSTEVERYSSSSAYMAELGPVLENDTLYM